MMFSDVNLYIVGFCFIAIAVAVWQVASLEGLVKEIKLEYAKRKEEFRRERDKNIALQSALNAKTDICKFLNDRIDRALAQGAAHPNSRPNKIMDILMDNGEQPEPTLFQKLTRGPDAADVAAYALAIANAKGEPPLEINKIRTGKSDREYPPFDRNKMTYKTGDRAYFQANELGTSTGDRAGVYELQPSHMWKPVKYHSIRGSEHCALCDRHRSMCVCEPADTFTAEHFDRSVCPICTYTLDCCECKPKTVLFSTHHAQLLGYYRVGDHALFVGVSGVSKDGVYEYTSKSSWKLIQETR